MRFSIIYGIVTRLGDSESERGWCASAEKDIRKIQFLLMKSRWKFLGCQRYIITFSPAVPATCVQGSGQLRQTITTARNKCTVKKLGKGMRKKKLMNDEDHVIIRCQRDLIFQVDTFLAFFSPFTLHAVVYMWVRRKKKGSGTEEVQSRSVGEKKLGNVTNHDSRVEAAHENLFIIPYAWHNERKIHQQWKHIWSDVKEGSRKKWKK